MARMGALFETRDGRFGAGVDAEGLAEIAARAAGDEAEHGVGRDRAVRVEEAVDRLVDRAVAADRDDLVMALAQRFAHQRVASRRARVKATDMMRIGVAQRALDRCAIRGRCGRCRSAD